MTNDQYPRQYPACIMCGAEAGHPCLVISTAHDEHYDQTAGDVRPYPHAMRSRPGTPGPAEPFVAVKDEPNHYKGEPHTAQCTEACPL